jgi:hypothetical protein
MEADHIKCPECGAEIEVGEVLARQIEADVAARLNKEADARLKRAVEETKAAERSAVNLELKDLEQRLKEGQKKLADAEARELAIRAQQRELEVREKKLEEDIAAKLKEREAAIIQQSREEAKAALAKQLTDMEGALKSREEAMEQARARELELLKEKRQLEEQRKEAELDYQRKLDAERRVLEEKIAERYATEGELKLRERDKQIEDLRKALTEAKRKSEQGSMETQGEALELSLESTLQRQFPQDTVEAVPKGIRGADLIHTVRNEMFTECGKIVWEAKNTKAWSASWIEKLKADQREVGANLAILVSTELPEGITSFGLVDGVWVCSVSAYQPLVIALREQLIQVSFARKASEMTSSKMEVVYNYLSGNEFRHKIEAIVESFVAMQDQLAKEKRAFQKQWKEREKQIERVIENTAGMYGDIRGLIGASIPEIKALSLDDDPLLLEATE